MHHNKVVVRIPKCAAMMLDTMLAHHKIRPPGFIHQTYKELAASHPSPPVAYAIVRNPYDRAFSAMLFIYTRRHRRAGFVAEDAIDFVQKNMIRTIADGRHHLHFMFRSMHDMLDGSENRRLVRFENLATEFSAFLDELLGRKNDLKPFKRHETLGYKTYQEFYTPEMVAFINERYKQDFEEFGYNML